LKEDVIAKVQPKYGCFPKKNLTKLSALPFVEILTGFRLEGGEDAGEMESRKVPNELTIKLELLSASANSSMFSLSGGHRSS
jgi:hypothetical protein